VLRVYINAFSGSAVGAETDARSEGTDIDEPLSPSAREIGFSFSKNASSSLSALAQSPPECLSPSKELALKDELSPVTEVPSDIRKLKFNIGASPSDFILEESESEEVQRFTSTTKDSQELFKPINESGESDELETVVEKTKPTAGGIACEPAISQSSEVDVKVTPVLRGLHDDAADSSDEERDIVDDGSGLDRMTLLSFDNIAYEDPATDLQSADHQINSKHVLLDVGEEQGAAKHHHGRHRMSISSDSDSEKLIDAEMVDIQTTLQTQFESTAASRLVGSLGLDQSETVMIGEEKKYRSEAVPAEPHESIRGTHDAEVLNSIESRRSNNLNFGANPPSLFGGFSQEGHQVAGGTEPGNAADTLIVSSVPEDVMKTSTSSDASAEPMILAATYDLDLGAVSRVIATYDISPDSVDKVFVLEKRTKVIQSSPDDEVFETESGGGKTASAKTEGSSDIAEPTQDLEHVGFDTNEMPFELVKADDVDGYEAYLEVMQQNRAVADQELGALLDLYVCGPDEMARGMPVESSLYTTDSAQENMESASSPVACVQPDLIRGMPRGTDVDILSERCVHSFAEVQENQSMVDRGLLIYDDDEPNNEPNISLEPNYASQHTDDLEKSGSPMDTFKQLDCQDVVCENTTAKMPASFGKGALESDNMYRVFQQDLTDSPADDDSFFGLQSEGQADDSVDEQHQKRKFEDDDDEDRDDDFLAESAEPELMILSADKEDEEYEMQTNLLDFSDDCPATATGFCESLLVLDSQHIGRPLSPLPDSAYRIVDDTDDAYVTRHVLRSSTADSAEDNLHSEQAAVIVSQVMANACAAAEDAEVENRHFQEFEVGEDSFQADEISDLVRKTWQSGSYNEEMDEATEGGFQNEHQSDIGFSGRVCEPMQHQSDKSETGSKSVDADKLLDLEGESVTQKVSEFVHTVVREAHVETKNLANRSQEIIDGSLANYTLSDLSTVDEEVEEFEANHENVYNVLSDLSSRDQTESSKSETGFNGTSFEWNGGEQTNLEDYGDSSSVDSFATVVPCNQEIGEDRMADLASVSSSIHSDLHSSFIEDQPEAITCLDARDEFLHEGETEDSSSSDHFENMRDDLDSSLVEIIPCYESPDEDKYGILDDDFDQPMMMLATIKEEDERSSISGKSGKTGSSSDRVDGTSDSDKQASSGDLHAEYPCRRMVGKSAEKDDISVSSSLLEFETLEKEMQDRTSLDSLTKMGSQQSVAERSSEASSSLLEFERIERELQDRTSHDSLTKLGSLQSVSEKDNVSISSSLAEFERLETEICVHEPTEAISAHATYAMAGSTTSLNAFLMDDLAGRTSELVMQSSQLFDQSLAFDEQLESEARAVVSMLEAGALPVMDDHMSVNKEAEPSAAADAEIMPAATDAGELPIYPEYQDIVQIIRKASETARENVEVESSRFRHHRPDVHEPDVDSLNEPDDDNAAMVTARGVPLRHVGDIDTDSLQGDGDADSLMHADQVVPDVSTLRADAVDVMETSADSIEAVPRDEIPALERSSDSLEMQQTAVGGAAMQTSVDSLTGDEDAQCLDSFDADSLHESSLLGLNAKHEEIQRSQTSAVESGAWSQSDSLLSNTGTLKSSYDDSSMRASSSLDSPNSKHDNNHVSELSRDGEPGSHATQLDTSSHTAIHRENLTKRTSGN